MKFLFEVVSTNQNSVISHRKVSRIAKRRSSNTKVEGKVKKRSTPKINMYSNFNDSGVFIDLPIQTVSEANNFEHWTKKHARHKNQQKIVALALKPLQNKIKLPCKIILTRLAPNKLDKFDNLPMSLKYIVDAICAIITGNYTPGKADSDERIEIACNQIKSKLYGVRIEINF